MEDNEQLSTEQLLLLENLTYLTDDEPLKTLVSMDEDKEGKETLTVKKAIEQIEMSDLDMDHNYGSLMTGEDWSNIIQAIEKDETLCQMKIVTVEPSKDSEEPECSSVLFVNEQTNEAVVAFRGTAPYEWKDNFLGGARTDAEDGVSTEYQEEALEWFESLHLEDGGYDTVTLIGHSKGGNKVKYITIVEELGLVDRCVSFDGQGFSDEFFDKYGSEIARNQWKITNHNVDYDYVNLLLNDVGRTTYYQGYDYGAGKIAEAHCPNTFFEFGEDGTVSMQPVSGQAEEMKAINAFLNSYLRTLSEEEKIKTMEVLGELIEKGFKGELAEDFASIFEEEGRKGALLGLAAYAAIYAIDHPEFTDAIDSIVSKFCLEDAKYEILWYMVKSGIMGILLPPEYERRITEKIINGVRRDQMEDRQIAATYWPLEKNRVFDISKMTLLGSTGKALMDTGSRACSEWEDAVSGVKNLYDCLESEIQSSALNTVLSALPETLKKDDYELAGTMLYNTISTITENIPTLDSDAADAVEEITEALSSSITAIKTIKEHITTNPVKEFQETTVLA